MYSPRSVDLAMRVAEKELGFEPIYHSLAACDQAVEYFDHKLERYVDEHGVLPGATDSPRFLFDEEEIKWIENERKLCMIDYLYFATRYGQILSEQEMIHYNPNKGQLIANDIRGILEDLQWAIILLFLKARQVGITTDSQMVVAHRTFFYPHVVAITGSSDKERSAEMVEKYHTLYDLMPYWLRPERTANRAGTRTVFGNQNSRLIIQHGAQKFDIGRGNTPSVFHLGELASYLNAEDLIDAGLMPAIHESPNILGIGESTGEGPWGWLFDTWHQCKENYWKRNGQARWCPVFLPWFIRDDYYPTRTWLRRNPVPEFWRPAGVTVEHARRAAKYVTTNSLLSKYFSSTWEMPREQLWYWENTREEHRKKRELAKFSHEYAADDIEAFMPHGAAVFDVDTLSGYLNHVSEPVAVYGFRTEDPKIIPPRLQADDHDRDFSKPLLQIGAYEMVPLRWEGWSSTATDGKLLIFEEPQVGSCYGFGVDTADGVGLNNTAVEGLRMGDLERCSAQVCEFASPYINALDLTPIVHCIALYYQIGSQMGYQPRIAIEVGLNGELTQLDLRKEGWSNFHLWIRYDRKDLGIKAARLGFTTNRWSRPMLIDCIVQALRNTELDIGSREFVKEMQALHRDENVQMARAEGGQSDDRFIALGIIFLSLNILEYTGRKRKLAQLRRHMHEKEQPVFYRDLSYGARSEPVEILALPLAQHALRSYFGDAPHAPFHPGGSSDTMEIEL